MSTVFILYSCVVQRAQRFGETHHFHLQGRRLRHARIQQKLINFQFASPSFLLCLFVDSEDGSDIFSRNIGLSPNYTALQPGRP
jgi:hypothetical protein